MGLMGREPSTVGELERRLRGCLGHARKKDRAVILETIAALEDMSRRLAGVRDNPLTATHILELSPDIRVRLQLTPFGAGRHDKEAFLRVPGAFWGKLVAHIARRPVDQALRDELADLLDDMHEHQVQAANAIAEADAEYTITSSK